MVVYVLVMCVLVDVIVGLVIGEDGCRAVEIVFEMFKMEATRALFGFVGVVLMMNVVCDDVCDEMFFWVM